MASANVEKLRAAHENFNRRDFDAVVRDAVDTFTYTDHPRGLILHGTEEFKSWLRGWTLGFSDARVTRATYHDAGRTVVAQFTGTGTNDGNLGELPATGRRMEMPFCEIWHFDDRGQMVAGEIYYDQLTLLTQLGHQQPQPAGAR